MSRFRGKTNIFKWIARLLGSISVSFYLFMVIGEMIGDLGPITLEGIMVVSFSVILLLSVIIAWKKESVGGTILITSSIAFAIFIFITAGTHKIMVSILISLPFLLSGILFRISSLFNKH